ncbi:MAG TPA: efflux transporter outer membrane subunit [Methylibium sp.]|uniref:efflux transporter outer membrane subunit n=1 Tax=Methylibium sp. TaxID=2067992 RepID=UPI002DB652C9|nr:efflux transporter outer membrane subunit [Methylibium sp.]HEU4458207.1 efflux transporter outer membrane subunit [Methylibium sp.]
MTLARRPAPCLRIRAALLALAAVALAGCAAVGPAHRAPEPAQAVAWQAPLPAPGSAPVAPAPAWWQAFDDPTLAALQGAALDGSPSVAQALARVEQARASAVQARAAALPSLAGSAGITRSRSLGTGVGGGDPSAAGSGAVISTSTSAAVDLNWEIDLFGAVRRSREAALARLDARVADAEAARLALEAEVASAYLDHRACLQLAETAERNADSTADTVKFTRFKTEAGFTAPAALARIEASLAEARSRATQQRGQCELNVKQLVELTGLDEPALRARLARVAAGGLPQPAALRIDAVPARVLERRRDLAAAERSLAAASADIGVAVADRLPRLSLLGSIGRTRFEAYGSRSEGPTWSIGPSLSLPLFDAGRRAAEVDAARARHAEAEGNYRAVARAAVREVEQALVNLDTALKRADDARAAADGYARYFESIDARYRVGAASVLELEEARRTLLAAREALIGVERDRIGAWITLHRATGGGWRAADEQAATAGASS